MNLKETQTDKIIDTIELGSLVIFASCFGRVIKIEEGKFWAKFGNLELEFLPDGRRYEWQRGPVVFHIEEKAA